jgi:hypothetical protein
MRACACDLILSRLTEHHDDVAPELWKYVEA